MAVKVEDASELRLGDEFEGETCLTNAEVAIILQEAKTKYEAEDRAVPEVFEQTLAYVNRFSQIKNPVGNKAAVEGLRSELELKVWEGLKEGAEGGVEEIKLRPFELVAAVNLKMDEPDEASALVPSMHFRMNADQIEEVLSTINRATGRTFQS